MTESGNTTFDLDEKLSRYRGLCAQRDDIAERLKRVELGKETVSQRIYEKVKAEYRSQLDDIQKQLEPLKGDLESQRGDLDRELDAVAQSIRALEDELAEADFRFRVGEYSEEQITEFRRRVEPRLEEERSRARKVEKRLSALDLRRNDEPADSAEASSDADSREGTIDDVWSSGPAHSANEPMENPQSWANPSPRQTRDDDRGAVPADEKMATALADPEDDDPLAALADPTTEKRPPVNPGASDPSGYPNLVVKSGVNEGKVIPLLPMTMTIGREHDNNIELKDPDVARYHARVVYDRGQYFIEDLESSSGTFVNGQKARRSPLRHGDIILVGTTGIAFEIS